MSLTLTWTQRCVLQVLLEHDGLARWSTIAREVRRRSGRSVRPNTSTSAAMRRRGLIHLSVLGVSMTTLGHEALSATLAARDAK